MCHIFSTQNRLNFALNFQNKKEIISLFLLSFYFYFWGNKVKSGEIQRKYVSKYVVLTTGFIFILRLLGLNDTLLNLIFFFIELKTKMYQMDYKCSFMKERNYIKLTLLFSTYLLLVLFLVINLLYTRTSCFCCCRNWRVNVVIREWVEFYTSLHIMN